VKTGIAHVLLQNVSAPQDLPFRTGVKPVRPSPRPSPRMRGTSSQRMEAGAALKEGTQLRLRLRRRRAG
jgi:hypothetical protein